MNTSPQLRGLFDNSNVDACPPVWLRNVADGYGDNSFGGDWLVYRIEDNSRCNAI